MATFSAQITELVGGTIDQTACDQWAVDGAREIIMQLPASLQEKCSDKTTVTSASPLDLDTASFGKILYCTRNNGSYDIPCRLISSVYASLADDSTASNYYATANDPAYFIRDNKVEIKPNPGGDGASYYYLVYPTSIDVSSVSSIASFPIEAEYPLILYVAMKQLVQYMSDMSSDYDDDIEDAFAKAKSLMTDDATFNALSTVTDDVTNTSALYYLGIEDTELLASVLQIVGTELSRASGIMSADAQQYGWYADQFAKLAGMFAAAIGTIKGA